jgi:hypothetical protein
VRGFWSGVHTSGPPSSFGVGGWFGSAGVASWAKVEAGPGAGPAYMRFRNFRLYAHFWMSCMETTTVQRIHVSQLLPVQHATALVTLCAHSGIMHLVYIKFILYLSLVHTIPIAHCAHYYMLPRILWSWKNPRMSLLKGEGFIITSQHQHQLVCGPTLQCAGLCAIDTMQFFVTTDFRFFTTVLHIFTTPGTPSSFFDPPSPLFCNLITTSARSLLQIDTSGSA